MSVGGTIVDIVVVSDEKWWIDTIDKSDLMHGGRTCAVYCDPRPERPEVGDSLWWQGGSCYWTPADRSRADVRLRKIGGSGVAHPDLPRCPGCDCTLALCRKNGVCETTHAREGSEHEPA